MLIATALVVCLLVAVVGLQAEWTRRFVKLFQQPKTNPVPVDQLPKVAVVLTLRGADPFLDRCVEGLMRLDYPKYDVRIVVDHNEDPAWELVQRIVAVHGAGRVKVSVLRDRRETCSLRMSSLIQAVADLDDSYDVVTLIDADVIPHAHWLRDLASAFADPEVGAASGIRWYMPDDRDAGSLVRYVWNAAGVVQMRALEIGWGGSLAVRTSVLRDAGILEKWSRIMFEDTFTSNEVHLQGCKIKFVPEATMINRESTSVSGCIRFISRQLLNARMYHRNWPAILAFGMAESVAMTAAPILGVAALLTGQTVIAGVIGAALAVYGIGMGWLLWYVESPVLRLAKSRGEPIPSRSWKLAGALLLTHFVYSVSLLMALRVREVEWRGIKYRLRGPRRVHLMEYRPYRPHFETANAPVSL